MASKINRLIGNLYENPGKGGKEGDSSGVVKTMESQMINVKRNTGSFFKEIKVSFSEFCKNHDVDFKYLFLAVPIIAIFLGAFFVNRFQSLFSKASIGTANIFIKPSSSYLPGQSGYQVWITTSAAIGFVSTEINYNPSLIKMSSEPVVSVSPLTRIIKVTSMSGANAVGKLTLVLALDPALISKAPSGTFQIANLNFDPVTTSFNVGANLSINTSVSQVIGMDQSVFNLTSAAGSIIINPTSTPVPTITPQSTPPSRNDNKGPDVGFNSPTQGSTFPGKSDFYLSVSAPDPAGTTSIEVSIDGNVVATCSDSRQCNKNIDTTGLSDGKHTFYAVAVDSFGNKASKKITATKHSFNEQTTPTPNISSDTVGPDVGFNSPTQGSTFPGKSDFYLSVSAPDISGTAQIKIFIDGDLVASCENNRQCNTYIDTTTLSDGVHTLVATATDASPNHNSSTKTITATKI